MHRVLVLLLWAACAAGVGCAPAEPAPAPARPHIVFVLLDTVRQHHLGLYGYERDTTPEIDALGAKGLVFDDAVAQSSWTLPSLASLLTSRYPSEMFHELDEMYAPSGRVYTLTQALDAAGYRTVSVATNPYNDPFFRMMEGFDERHFETSANADWVVDRALAALDAARAPDAPDPGAPLFLYLHFMDLHHPLTVPPPWDGMYPTLDGAPHDQNVRAHLLFDDPDQLDSEAFRVYRSHKLALYDGGLRFIDHEIGRLVRRLEAAGMLDDTVIVVAGDHGQEFWDHSAEGRALGLERFHHADSYGLGHGHTLFPELVRVPLIFAGRGVPVGRVATRVRNIDVVPTLLGLAGVEDASLDARGVDLVAAIRAGTLADLPAFTETVSRSAEQRSLLEGRFQLLRLDDREVLFDLESGALVDVAAAHPDAVARLRGGLDGELGTIDRPAEAGPKIGDRVRSDLRALGYID